MADQEIPGVESTTRLYRQSFGGEQPTLRDQIAMAALTGLIESRTCGPTDYVMHAVRAYKFADAMLAARERK